MTADVSTMAPDGGERAPRLEGGRNFRDLGGYQAADGRRVKWGRVFRSGSPAALSEADWSGLVALGVRGLCDLRSTQERLAAPFAYADAHGFAYWARDHGSSFGELRVLMASDFPSGEAAREAMMTGYRRLPFHQAPAYGEIFRRLRAGETPLIFNCSAGKDRAGTGAALILTALGVSREQVLEDYLLSNRYLDVQRMIADAGQGPNLLARQPPEVVDAIMRCDLDYLGAALDAVEETCGSFEAYLGEVLGVDAEGVEVIRGHLLE